MDGVKTKGFRRWLKERDKENFVYLVEAQKQAKENSNNE